MKSIMQEASSLSKAIDQAWTRAGKPAEFTVKILEEPEHNMFGLTTKPAKIAFFFDERATALTTTKPTEHKPRPQRQPQIRPQKAPEAPKKPEPKPAPAKEPEQRQAAPKRQKWSDDMIQTAQDWLKGALSALQKDISFTVSSSGNSITFRLNGSPTGDQNKDRLLFAGFAHLIMATLRNKYKKSLRFHKVILITQ